MIQKILVLTILILQFHAGSYSAFAQSSYTLSSCIRIATAQSAKVKQAETAAQIADVARKGSGHAYIPTLSLSSQNDFSTGRVLDPTTYEFVVSRTVYDMGVSIGGSMTLFSGFERSNSIRKARLDLQHALLEAEKTRNDVSLGVTALFLNIVLDKEAARICERKISMLESQEEIIRRKLECSAVTTADLLSIQADIAKAKVELSSACNNLNLDKLAMCELLGVDDWESFDVATEGEAFETIEPRLWCISDVVSSASRLPQIRQGELAIDIAKRDVNIARSSYWPTISLNAGYGSTYSSARTRTGGAAYAFPDQLRDNMSSYVTLSLNIPILSSISVSNSVKRKKLACARAEYELANAKIALDKEVKQAIVNANTAYEKYLLLETDVDKCREVLRQTQAKYDVGAVAYGDYIAAVGNLFQAEAQQQQSKYEYILRTRIIDFYAGRPMME